jgi:glycine betaine catabolism B
VAIAVVLTSLGFDQSASWWVGSMQLLPFVAIGGLLVVRKIRREDMMYSFFTVVIISVTLSCLIKGTDIITGYSNVFLHSACLFFSFVMLTEPLTTPPTRMLQIVYGAIVGMFYNPALSIGGIYSTPELALVLGNVFSYLFSPKDKLILPLLEKVKLTPDTYDFVFPLQKKLSFVPGQYMEWTLPHKSPDSRGNRRYFTLASSPTEETLRMGIKFYDPASSFKKALWAMGESSRIVAAQRAGDFTMPEDAQKKLVFVAGGIGVTPFRSMLKYLIDTNERRDVIVLYSNKNVSEIAYADIFTQATQQLGIKVVYILTDKTAIPQGWQGEIGRVDAAMVQKNIPDYADRLFYLSGPHAMVTGFESTLKQLGVKSSHVKKDFFPGFV